MSASPFCENYISVGDPVAGLPVKKHDGKLEEDGHYNGWRELHVDYSDRRNDLDRANLVVLQHIDVVDDYVAQHKETIAKKYRDKGMLKMDDEVTVEHNATFLRWFKQQVLENPPKEGSSDGLLIDTLAHGPAPKLSTY